MKKGIAHFVRNNWILVVGMGLVYTVICCWASYMTNGPFYILNRIDPYSFAMSPIDFFSPLVFSILGVWYFMALKKDGFLKEVAGRTQVTGYIKGNILASLILSFAFCFVAIIIIFVFSVKTAVLMPSEGFANVVPKYILGDMQVNQPILFGIMWSFHKALILQVFSLVGIAASFLSSNFFIAALMPMVVSFLDGLIFQQFGLGRINLDVFYRMHVLNPNRTSALTRGIIYLKYFLIAAVAIHYIAKNWRKVSG